MNHDENLTLLGREEISGKFKNQRLWNVTSLILGFSVIFLISWFLMKEQIGLDNKLIGALTCFPGTIFALMIAELFSKLLDR
tara:strand:+ start:475 stop:720 length:246 start_codon:yes stop_codon:yes gene_type:complete